jgi:hypothetical protein
MRHPFKSLIVMAAVPLRVGCVLGLVELKSVTRVQPSYSWCTEVQHQGTTPLWSGLDVREILECCISYTARTSKDIQRRRGVHYASFHAQQVRWDMSYGFEMCSNFTAGRAVRGVNGAKCFQCCVWGNIVCWVPFQYNVPVFNYKHRPMISTAALYTQHEQNARRVSAKA